MHHYLFTSESVSRGHPDKIADQISDAILDACLAQDSNARVACETLVTSNLIVVSGEITTNAFVDYEKVIRHTIEKIGYTDLSLGFDANSCQVHIAFNQQSLNIAQGIDPKFNRYLELGAGDQGVMFGFACLETENFMPLPISLAHLIVRTLREKRESGLIPYLRPDAKSQVTVEYDENHQPLRVHTIVLSTQHSQEIDQSRLIKEMHALLTEIIPPHFIDKNTRIFINPAGTFIVGGPKSDCGLTGRKIIVDTYGGMCRHGGGAFSGKDPTKVDRSASYTARYIAKNIVAAKLAQRCEIQLSYAIGIPYPLSIYVNTFGTGVLKDDSLIKLISTVFQLTPKGMIDMLQLQRPIYEKTAFEGHFGRNELEFTWEKTDKIQSLQQLIQQQPDIFPLITP